jgi:hypothetical protein
MVAAVMVVVIMMVCIVYLAPKPVTSSPSIFFVVCLIDFMGQAALFIVIKQRVEETVYLGEWNSL